MDAWSHITPPRVRIPTMLTSQEMAYLYWLGRDYWRDDGHVVEMGPWLGGSTAALASGARDRAAPPSHRIHTFDSFIWHDFMFDRAPLPLADGESFFEDFERYIRPYDDLIVPHVGALPDEGVPNDAHAKAIRMPNDSAVPVVQWREADPVEILFIDGAKSWTGTLRLVDVFHAALMTDRSLVVCQDYKYWGCYWVPMAFELLAEAGCLSLAHNVTSTTTTSFLLRGRIDSSLLSTLPSFDALTEDRGLELLESSARRIEEHGDRPGAQAVRMGKARFLAHKGDRDRAVATFRELEARWPVRVADRPLQQARQWLQNETGLTLSPHWRSRARKGRRLTASLARRLRHWA